MTADADARLADLLDRLAADQRAGRSPDISAAAAAHPDLATELRELWAVAQFAHLESCTKARNADLYAVCDAAPDLLARMAAFYAPERTFTDYDAMLADPAVEAVIVATSDAWHVPAAIAAQQERAA